MPIPIHPIRRVAAWNRFLRKVRVLGFLPANVIVIFLLGLVVLISGSEAFDSSRSDRKARPVSLERVFAKEPMINRHVEVTGMIFPEANITNRSMRKGIAGPVHSVHVAMLPEGGKQLLLIKFNGDLGHGEPRLVTVAGLLRPPESALSRSLDAWGGRLAGLPVERRYVLVAGMTPAPVWLHVGIASAAALLMLGFLITFRGGSVPAPPVPTEETHDA